MPKALEAMEGMTFGCDPEVFVVDIHNRPVYPEFIPGTKEEPFKVPGGALQRDGCAAEFNIDPVTNYKDFTENINKVLTALEAKLPKDHSLSFVPHVVFDKETWDKIPEEGKELGCSPDFNAWEMSVNSPPDGEVIPRMRTAAGHLHIGWGEDIDPNSLDHVKDCMDLVKQLDWYLGVWSVSQDKDPVRRSLYGKAGASRIKPYGVEYRVLSNFWVKESLDRLKIWNRMIRAIEYMPVRYLPEYTDEHFRTYQFNDRVVRSINDSSIDAVLAENFGHTIMKL